MIVFGAALVGAIVGGMTARNRGGNKLDIAQYAASFGIAFALLGLIATVVIHRLAI
ncbi:apolipoprotein acyltransferase [Pontibaca salina]|uniref:Apolipoprotein acyltransferase n=1 Tax=Pontibaca salina TaxID=2795731 RepID=A0A934HSE4_9RHOB|nr:apolipoprotein acyltransferase [Pontibaca salina]MBI6629825.1 apolipoprotein acyltransferase [Pontibaca salina]